MARSYGALVLKRMAAALFALALVATLVPMTAWAAGADAQAEETAATGEPEGRAVNIAQGQVGTCAWRIESNGRLVIAPLSGNATGDLGTISYNYGSSVTSGASESTAPWYPRRDQIKSVKVEQGVRGSATMTGLFYNCKSLTSVDIAHLDTSNVQKIDGMFEGCTSLSSFTMPNFNLNRCTSMIRMFYGCTALKSVDMRYVDTSNVQRMDLMFRDCTALTNVNLSGFKTKSAKGMYEMFRNCSSLTSIDVSSFDVTGVTDMWSMFQDCKKLTKLDLSNFVTNSLGSMQKMFYGCSSVTSIDISGFKTSTGTDRGPDLFYGCNALERVSVGKDFTFKGDRGLGTQLPTSYWVSSATGATYTSNEVAQNRSNMADTYVKYKEVTSAPAVIMGNGLNWARGSLSGAAFRSSAEFADFVCVRIDGSTIDRANYEVKEGSTLVTLRPDYLEKISNGQHKIEIVSATGTANANFTISGETNITVLNPITMFRLYNPKRGEHFYTSSTVERDDVISKGWNDEGTGWVAPASGDPVYRLYNSYGGEHHYTTSAVERDHLIAEGWNDEGVGWYSGGAVELTRQYNPNAYANNHNYTSSALERENLLSLGWHDEGVAWYGVG